MLMRTIGTLHVGLAYAAGHHGGGVCYLRIRGTHDRIARIPFNVRRLPGLDGREVGYAALAAAARVLQQRGVERARIVVPDADLARDLTARRSVAAALVLPYVQAQCALNTLKDAVVEFGEDPELDARARMEAGVGAAA